MTQKYEFDIIVIGAGIAGLVAAVTANGLGKKIAVVEKNKIGGNCTNTTCIPSKALIRMAHLNRELVHLKRNGMLPENTEGLIATGIFPRIRGIVQKAYEKDVPETFEDIGITVISGEACMESPHEVRVGPLVHTAEKIILAVGTIPVVPDMPGLTECGYLTNENIYDQDELPESVMILGGGVDGLEYASALGRLGVNVSILEAGMDILPNSDRELVINLKKILHQDGIALRLNTRATRFWMEDNQVIAETESHGVTEQIKAAKVLVTIGRKPDFTALHLERAGVRFGPKGVVTDKTLRTTCPNIYACGDIVGPDLLATTAEYQGIVAATNASVPIRTRVDYSNSVNVVFTIPTLAQIGLTELQALRKYGPDIKVYRFDYHNMRRALIDGTPEGTAKIICDKRDRLIGAHILGEAAAELIHEAQILKSIKKPLSKFNLVTHAYPTYSQAVLGRASQLAFLDKMSRSNLVKTALSVYPGLKNNLRSARDRLAEENATQEIQKGFLALEREHGNESEIAVVRNDRACVLRLPRVIDHYEHGAFLDALKMNTTRPPQNFVLDFSRVEIINGLGAGLILKLYLALRGYCAKFVAIGVNSDLKAVFAVTNLDEVLEIHDSGNALLSKLNLDKNYVMPEAKNCLINFRNWAPSLPMLTLPKMPKEARNLNVNGLKTAGPVKGFGQFWQKVYQLILHDKNISAQEVIQTVKNNFPAFQPHFNCFYPSPAGIQPGEVVLIDSMTPGGPVSTGVMIMYCDDVSFTFNTPQGHPEAGWVSFTAYAASSGPIFEIAGLARANDPIYEAAFRAIGSQIQVKIWTHVLRSLSAYYGLRPDIRYYEKKIDANVQWQEWRNVWYNAQVRTLIREPLRWIRLGSGQ